MNKLLQYFWTERRLNRVGQEAKLIMDINPAHPALVVGHKLEARDNE